MYKRILNKRQSLHHNTSVGCCCYSMQWQHPFIRMNMNHRLRICAVCRAECNNTTSAFLVMMTVSGYLDNYFFVRFSRDYFSLENYFFIKICHYHHWHLFISYIRKARHNPFCNILFSHASGEWKMVGTYIQVNRVLHFKQLLHFKYGTICLIHTILYSINNTV